MMRWLHEKLSFTYIQAIAFNVGILSEALQSKLAIVDEELEHLSSEVNNSSLADLSITTCMYSY